MVCGMCFGIPGDYVLGFSTSFLQSDVKTYRDVRRAGRGLARMVMRG